MNNKSIKEIIKARYSVRNYDSKTLSDEIINKINSYIKDLTNPFNREVKIKLIENLQTMVKLNLELMVL